MPRRSAGNSRPGTPTGRGCSDLDEGALIRISDETNGKFFRAMDTDTIQKTFAAIDAAQKIEFQAKSYLLTTELFTWFASPGAILLFLGALFALPPQMPLGRARPLGAPSNTGRPSGVKGDSAHGPALPSQTAP